MTDWLDSPDGRSATREIGAFVDTRREELVGLLGSLIAERSPNPPGDCAGVARALTDWLGTRGIACETVARVESKPNLVSTVASGKPGPHLILNGHMDTITPGDEFGLERAALCDDRTRWQALWAGSRQYERRARGAHLRLCLSA